MRRLAVTIGAILILGTAHVSAADERFERSLKMLDPVDRLEQLCDYAAMTQIKKDHHEFRPDRAVAGNEAHIKGDTIVTKDGAFRSRKKWYVLSYTCTAAPDHFTVSSFHYTIGDEIPESKWASYGLWD
ncbi:MAG TPA: DUF930 domain-containing protein [Pseudolabrys sp.]|nr:DUF930 domain-containing protein [Pseudolabrys sp.]